MRHLLIGFVSTVSLFAQYSPDAVRKAENFLLYQLPSGGWDKNIDMSAPPGPA